MFSNAIPNLKTYLKKDLTSTRYFVQGKGEIKLTRSDFKAQGGEGSIYVKGATAYKIYLDPTRTISSQKILELSALSQSNIIRPMDILLNRQNLPVGYSMRNVGNSYSLCQLFPRAFRQRNNLTPELTLKLVRQLQEGVAHVHNNGILIVDLNELNFLVAKDFRELFFIDVDSYQTTSFPATVLMESVRDRHSQVFTTNTDWFSFAIVSFQMFTGIHPFKGTYPPLQQLPDAASKLNARMLSNVSVLHHGVTVPMSCLSFAAIPPVYLDWFRAVFEEGKRLAPPKDVLPQIILRPAVTTPASITGTAFLITRLREFDSPILSHDGSVTITEKSVYFDGKRFEKPAFDVKVVVTPRQRHVIAAFIDSSGLHLRDLTRSREIETNIKAEDMSVCAGQLFLKQAESIFAVDFVELPNQILVGIKLIANVMMRATQLFEGLAFQNLLGAIYASIFVSRGGAFQVRLPELDGHQIVDAKLERNVLVVVIVKNGSYDKLIYRFSKQFDAYDVRVIRDIATTGIEFTVLDSGVVLQLTDDDKLEIFSVVRGSTSNKTLSDAGLVGEVRLFHTGVQALFARGAELYRIQLKA